MLSIYKAVLSAKKKIANPAFFCNSFHLTGKLQESRSKFLPSKTYTNDKAIN